MLSESIHDLLHQRDPFQPGLSWCRYYWRISCPTFGDVLLALGITFPSSSICSLCLLIECWRQIALIVEKVC